MKRKNVKHLEPLQKKIGYAFKDIFLLELALTHSSFKNELRMRFPGKTTLADNERLEFLGDTILAFIISKRMFSLFKDCTEGELSKYRSLLVSKEYLFKVAREIKLVRFLNLGKGEASSTISEKSNILANTVEALIAAIYLDSDMHHAERFIIKYFGHCTDERKLSRLDKNYKSALQEYSQKKLRLLPSYKTVDKKGQFYATVHIMKSKKGTGWGKTKREAEQEAAKNLLKKLKK